MKNQIKMTMLLLAVLVTGSPSAFATAVTGTRASLQSTKDDSGYPVQIESDRPWKVFAVENTTSETQVTDEDGKTPTTGVLHKVCLESAPAFPAADDWAVVWDSSAITGTTAAGRRLLPPIMRASRAEKCTDVVDLIFTKGLRVLNGASTGVGGTYIYWRELGAKR